MLKKTFLSIIILIAVLIACISCGKSGQISFTDAEEEILKLMENDYYIVHDEEFVSVVSEVKAHTHEYLGMVFVIEGVYSEKLNKDSDGFVYRKVVNGEHNYVYGLPLSGINTEIAEDSWVRVIGIVNGSADHETSNTFLDVLMITPLDQPGTSIYSAE